MCTGFDFRTKLFIKYVYRFWFYYQINYQIFLPILNLPRNWLSNTCTGIHLAPNLLSNMCTGFDSTTKLIIKYVYRFWFYHQIDYQIFVPVLILTPNLLSSMCTSLDLVPNLLSGICTGFYLALNLLSSMCTGFDFTIKLIIKYSYRFWFYHKINYQIFLPILI
jgi:hypothetical protein